MATALEMTEEKVMEFLDYARMYESFGSLDAPLVDGEDTTALDLMAAEETPIAGTKKHAEQVAAKQVLVLLGERLPTNASESVAIETLFAVWDLLKPLPMRNRRELRKLVPNFEGTLGIAQRAAVRYLKYVAQLQSRVASEIESLHQRIQELEAENAALFELLESEPLKSQEEVADGLGCLYQSRQRG